MVFSCLTSQISYVSTLTSFCLKVVELCKDMVNRLGMRVELHSVGEISQRDWRANGYSVRGDAYVEFIIGADWVANGTAASRPSSAPPVTVTGSPSTWLSAEMVKNSSA